MRVFKFGATGITGQYWRCPACQVEFEFGAEMVLAPVSTDLNATCYTVRVGSATMCAVPIHRHCMTGSPQDGEPQKDEKQAIPPD